MEGWNLVDPRVEALELSADCSVYVEKPGERRTEVGTVKIITYFDANQDFGLLRFVDSVFVMEVVLTCFTLG